MKVFAFATLLLLPTTSTFAQSVEQRLNDFPTETRADYIFGCMAVNGQSRDVLRRCACSVDTIASIITFDEYVSAETVLSMQQANGERMSMFKTTTMAREIVAKLRRAQAEAELLCF